MLFHAHVSETVLTRDASSGLHSIEVLTRESTKKLVIGQVKDQEPQVHVREGRRGRRIVSSYEIVNILTLSSIQSLVTSPRFRTQSQHGWSSRLLRRTTQTLIVGYLARCVSLPTNTLCQWLKSAKQLESAQTWISLSAWVRMA